MRWILSFLFFLSFTVVNAGVPWVYYGTYGDSFPRAMQGNSFSDYSTLTIEVCGQACDPYPYFGLQAGVECWCGNSLISSMRYGTTPSYPYTCPGDSSEYCGQDWANELYAQGYTYVGCYRDNIASPAMSYLAINGSTSLTVAQCSAACTNYAFFALQNSKMCYCSNSPNSGMKYGISDSCGFCGNDVCGGFEANSLFFRGWSYVGCYPTGTFSYLAFNSPSMTLELCFATCQAKGFGYFAAENQTSCYCGQNLVTNQTTGCTSTCAGNSYETCGGPQSLTVYLISTQYQGCYQNNTQAFPYIAFNNASLTNENCASACAQAGYVYYGLQGGTLCSCGNSLSQATQWGISNSCNVTCQGNSYENCGDSNANAIFSVCPFGYFGFPCVQAFCPAEDEFGYQFLETPAADLQAHYAGCDAGYTNSVQLIRTCLYDPILGGVWSNITNPCLPIYCPADNSGNASWPQTLANGSTVVGTCDSNYGGTPTRTCTQSGSTGVWSSVSNPCSLCGNNGVLVNSGCACYSGYYGSGCATSFATCPNLATVAPLNTTAVAELVNYQVANNYFTFGISSPSYNRRYFSDISINSNRSCAYPESSFFTHQVSNQSGCADIYTGNFSIPDLIGCGWNAQNIGANFEITGPIHVTAIDSLGSFRGAALARGTSSELTVTISIPNTVTVNTTQPVTVLSAINPTYAITQQVYDTNTMTLTVVMTSSVQYPYQLTNPVITGPFPSNTLTVTANPTYMCPGSPNNPCWQDTTVVWNIVNPSTCDVSGPYSFTWNYNCTNGFADCPADISGTETVMFNIMMDNPCPVTTIDVHVLGTLESFSNNLFTNQQLIFVAGETMFFQATFTSDITIQTIDLSSLVIGISQGSGNAINQELSNTTNQFYNDLTILGYTANNNAFGFTIMADVGPGSLFDTNRNPDATFTFQVSATFDITYKTTFGKKRDVATKSFELTSQGVLRAHSSVEAASKANAGSILSVCHLYVIAAAFLLCWI